MIEIPKIDLNTIENSKYKEFVVQIINLLESILSENDKLKEEILLLKSEIARLKGENGPPTFSTKKGNYSSQKRVEKAEQSENTNKKGKRSKLEILPIDEVLHCSIDKEHLPTDAIYKGTDTKICQNIIFKRNIIKLEIEVYYSPSEKKTYRAEVPKEYNGWYSQDFKAFCQIMVHGLDVTRRKLNSFLTSMGFSISPFSTNSILFEDAQILIPEKRSILRAGLQSDFTQIDSTSVLVKGENYHTQIIASELFTVYSTQPTKSRQDILYALQGEPQEGILLEYNNKTDEFLDYFNIGIKYKEQLKVLFAGKEGINKTEFTQIIEEHIPTLLEKNNVLKKVIDAFSMGYYTNNQKEFPAPKILLSDDAPEYRLLTKFHMLCWLHDFRHYKLLIPKVEALREIQEDFFEEYWNFYKQLHQYKLAPTQEQQISLTQQFEDMFSGNTQYFDLNKEMERTLGNEEKLLTVLKFPHIPLHNNTSELAARTLIRKRDISLHTMTDIGTQLRDAMLSIIQTSKKLGVNYWEYIQKRIRGEPVISLENIILSRING